MPLPSITACSVYLSIRLCSRLFKAVIVSLYARAASSTPSVKYALAAVAASAAAALPCSLTESAYAVPKAPICSAPAMPA